MNDIVFVAQNFLDLGEEINNYMLKQESIISMYRKRYGPLKSNKLKISVHAQATGNKRPCLVGISGDRKV